MVNHDVCTNLLHIVAGTDNSISSAYIEAARNIEDSNKTLKYLKNFMTSIENIRSKSNAVDKRITASKGNMKDFDGYESIQTILKFLKTHKTPSGNSITNNLVILHDSLEKNQSYYEEGFRKNIRLIMLEYESVLYMLVSGLNLALSYNFDVADKGGRTNSTEKPGAYFGVTGKTVKELATELAKSNHTKYLEELIRAHDQKDDPDDEKKDDDKKDSDEIKESVFTEGSITLALVMETIGLLQGLWRSTKSLVRFGVNGLRTLKQTVFGIVPLIRSSLYLSYKRKGDMILGLEQQAAYIEKNMELLNTRTNIDPHKKEEILSRQQAQAEACRKRAAKIRAELMEGDKDAEKAIKQEDPQMGKIDDDDDFVLEGVDIETLFYEASNTSVLKKQDSLSMNSFKIKQQKSGIRTSADNTEHDEEFLSKWSSTILPEFINSTKTKTILLDIGTKNSADNDPKKRTVSKYGGTPYWPADKPYPVYKRHDGKTTPYILIAQLNFSELPHIDGFPTSGILQIFGEDLVFELTRGRSYNKIVFHDNISKEMLQDIPITSCNCDTTDAVFSGVYFIKGSIKEEAMNMHDYRFLSTVCDLINKHTSIKLKNWVDLTDVMWQTIHDDLKKYLWENKIGGYPSFTQYDPRDYDRDKRKYDTLLLQIDSKNGIMWGDCGIANYFISSANLKAKKFNDVFFTWDCG